MTSTPIEGARNFRDLGGYCTSDGHVVRAGQVFRSAHLANLTEAGLAGFQELGIRTVIDFRPEIEKEMTGHDRLPDTVGYVNVAIGDPTLAPEVHRAITEGDFTALRDLEKGNRHLIREHAGQLGQTLRIIATESNLPLVFHCIGGKDRTGMAAVLLLAILGVPREAIKADYLKSNDAVAATPQEQEVFFNSLVKRSGATAELTDENRHALRRFFVLQESYLDAAWDEIDQVAGSFRDYVEHHLELTDQDVAALRATLLEPNGSDAIQTR